MRISVVIPCYNGEPYLIEAIRSIDHQTLKPYEVLLIDDGSTDDSIHTAYDNGVFFISNPQNMGIGYTRQRGMEKADGSHVAFLSADDVYHPNFLESCIKGLRAGRATYTNFFRCTKDLVPFNVFNAPQFSRAAVIEWALRRNMFVNFSTAIIPRDTQIEFEKDLRHGEDIIFLLDSVRLGLKWRLIPKPLLYYREHEEMGSRKLTRDEYEKTGLYIRNRLHNMGISDIQIRHHLRWHRLKRSLRKLRRLIRPG